MFNLTRPFAVLLALTLSLDAVALSLQSEKRADGTTVLQLTNAPAPARPPQLNEDPAVRAALIDFIGYATGSFTSDGSMIVTQVLDSLDSEFSTFEKGVPAGRKMLTAMDHDHGDERAALLLNDKGQLIAVGLVNGHCTVKSRTESLSCNPGPETVLTIFQAKDAQKSDAEPIIAWSKELPPMVAFWAESEDPETRALAQKIATVEYITTDPKKDSWSAAQLPADFPKAMLALLPKNSHLVGAGVDGFFTTPGLKGAPIYGDYDELAGRPRHDFEVLLKTYTPFSEVVKFYQEQAKGAELRANDEKALIDGVAGGGTYKIEIKDEEEEGTSITFSGWRKEV
ncbi:hypothetical protein PUP68_27220 [Pseudomonas chlororaphis]|uniref:hypothetical protein n=1 Tax=Pseudomonas chlororaphis TaxID=587753 RepID=UPI0006A61E36|nr:hypothetical protein [Pseudomonas chlororaphis]AZC33144.1 hypothetical protein C4K38_5207 [Pseudomonas chlororaphis subsp. piscium]WDG76266.1 hypothetical protein PUP77_17640 [Pseudomonas chlororaphis]WDG84495.1 hypothetical protein PUP68_27220 [Pseudomonas chlororaphis]WDG90822.1 hypothetical protein PUP49_26665 [Pseudomonas chlororaphis]SDS40575.1 hypothetical protein SAMN05216585_2184 [Pseudomonas chlororaphis]